MKSYLPSLAFAAAIFTASVLPAQQITLQQPVIQNFSVGTTVSVPDRGSTHLGSVGSAFSGRTITGPFRNGSSFGFERQSASTSAHVYIHDFEAMDAELLATAPARPPSKIEPRIAARLQQRRVVTTSPAVPAADRRIEAECLAEQAEARGKAAVARLHWQRAAKHGSTRAAQRLR